MKGVTFNIQRFSLHDGPGIRTTIFLKGCPMRCQWCCNPESFISRPQIMLSGQHPNEKGIRTGEYQNSDSLWNEIKKDKEYFINSGGGITLSGGEPLFQPEFAITLLQLAKSEQVHTALETTGFTDERIFSNALEFTDLLLFDFKHHDPLLHKKYTGVSNEKILNNLEKANASGTEIHLRCIMVPGIHDNDEHLKAITNLSNRMDSITKVELMPYHNYGTHKYRQLGIKNPEIDQTAVESDTLDQWKKRLSELGCRKLVQE